MSISDNLRMISGSVPGHVKVVAVSKNMAADVLLEAYHSGQRAFGENKAQEMISKQSLLPGDIEWHFIGHLQTNKVRYLIPFVHLIQSVDSFKLLREIDREAVKIKRVVSCLLQFHISQETTKFGLDQEEAFELLYSEEYKAMKHTRICGVMGMATFTDDMDEVRAEFRNLKTIFGELKSGFFTGDPAFREISMGMSGDYQVAIEEGSTIVRIGTAIFGSR
jgi:PLP dependent protein